MINVINAIIVMERIDLLFAKFIDKGRSGFPRSVHISNDLADFSINTHITDDVVFIESQQKIIACSIQTNHIINQQ